MAGAENCLHLFGVPQPPRGQQAWLPPKMEGGMNALFALPAFASYTSEPWFVNQDKYGVKGNFETRSF